MAQPRCARPRALSLLVTAITLSVMTACSSGSSAAVTKRRVPPPAPLPRSMVLVSTNELSAAYGQGIAKTAAGWVLSGSNIIALTDDALGVAKEINPAIPPEWAAKGYNHVGDIDVVGNVIYAPLEQSDYTKNQQAMARYDATTLTFLDAVTVHQSHNSFVAVDGARHVAYSSNLFDDHALLRYDIAQGWKPLPALQLSQPLVHIQGGAIGGGAFWISTNDPTHGVFVVDLASGRVHRLGSTGHLGGEAEGIAYALIAGAALHTLTLDANIAPNYADHWRLEK